MTDTPVPVAQIENIRQRWRNVAAGTDTTAYDELVLAAVQDVEVLAGYALGNVQAAFNAGYVMQAANERAHALMLRGLDVLHTWWAAGLEEEAQPPVLHEVLAYRTSAIKELDEARAVADAQLAVPNAAAEQAARYERGPVGAPPARPPAAAARARQAQPVAAGQQAIDLDSLPLDA